MPGDYLLRKIDRVLDLGDLHRQLVSFYSHTGRSSVDPELMLRMLLVGYCYGIRPSGDCATRRHLAALDQAAPLDNAEVPASPPAEPKATSLTDPAAAWTYKGQMKVDFAYGTNYLIDLRQAIIVDVEATPARWSAEGAATKTMLERTEECFGLKPQRLAADAGYRSRLMIDWLMRRKIERRVPKTSRFRR